MQAFGLVLIGFGILVIVFPALISILIGVFFITAGINMCLFWFFSRRSQTERFRFGSFEIVRNRPKSDSRK